MQRCLYPRPAAADEDLSEARLSHHHPVRIHQRCGERCGFVRRERIRDIHLDVCIKFILLNTKSIIFNAKFNDLNANRYHRPDNRTAGSLRLVKRLVKPSMRLVKPSGDAVLCRWSDDCVHTLR